MTPRTQEARSIEQFREVIAPMLDALRKQWEAEDAALLAMHPGAPYGLTVEEINRMGEVL